MLILFMLDSTGSTGSSVKWAGSKQKLLRKVRILSMLPIDLQDTGRLIAIGDIHGCSAALESIIDSINPSDDDVIVTLGDYVDRGPDTPGVLDQLIALRRRCKLVPLLGNHDQVMLAAIFGKIAPKLWMEMDGDKTVEAYGSIRDIPPEHTDFLSACELCVETDSHIFMHACYNPNLELEKQSIDDLLWTSLRDEIPAPHKSGKQAIVGHTSQKSGAILNAGHIICIDTFCCGGGWLTALDVRSGGVWQADREGRSKRRSKRTQEPSE